MGLMRAARTGATMYRPIVKAEEAGRQPSQQQQLWKTRPVSEEDYNWVYKEKKEGANYRKDDTTGLWMIPESDPYKVKSVTEETFKRGAWGKKDFFSSDNYVKDKTTNRMVAAPTEETCKANNGFVCKVSMITMKTTKIMISFH